MYSSLLAPGGMIGFHDIVLASAATGVEVSRFWRETKSRFRQNEIIENRNQLTYGVGPLYV
jgi:hypothetical protein